MIAALAGRRIDKPGTAPPVFPLRNEQLVADRISTFFEEESVTNLVCSAANGADLIALEIALDSDVACRIILPTGPDDFKTTSVSDRPGDWDQRFDQVLRRLRPTDDLIVMGSETPESHDAYEQVNEQIFAHAMSISRESNQPIVAVAVWNKKMSGTEDLTASFIKVAKRNNIRVVEVATA
jgi:hypothetical protein